MPVVYVCSNCMKRAPGQPVKDPNSPKFGWLHPVGWHHCWDEDTKAILDVCSRECGEAVNQKTQVQREFWGDVMAEEKK